MQTQEHEYEPGEYSATGCRTTASAAVRVRHMAILATIDKHDAGMIGEIAPFSCLREMKTPGSGRSSRRGTGRRCKSSARKRILESARWSTSDPFPPPRRGPPKRDPRVARSAPRITGRGRLPRPPMVARSVCSSGHGASGAPCCSRPVKRLCFCEGCFKALVPVPPPMDIRRRTIPRAVSESEDDEAHSPKTQIYCL